MNGQEVRLEELIARLEAERGMGRKARLLVGSWPLLRTLSPAQRERVAVAVGRHWTWSNLEALFGRPDEMSENQRQVKVIFEKMRDADPDELGKLAKELKRGNASGARSRLLGALGHALEEEIAGGGGAERPGRLEDEAAEPETSDRPPVAPPPPPRLRPSMLEQLEAQPLSNDSDSTVRPRPEQARVETARRSEPGEPGEPAVDAAPPDVDDEGPSRTAPKRLEDEPASRLRMGERGPLAASPRQDASPPLAGMAPAGPRIADASAAQASDRGPGDVPSKAGVAIEQDQEEPADVFAEAPADHRRRDPGTLSALESLRALRRLSSGEAASSRSGRAKLIDSLDSGWAARRAVSSMIRSHAPANLDEALALIRGLPASQRAWCLGDLLEHWQLDDQALTSVLAAAPSQAARRRLERRAARPPVFLTDSLLRS